MAFATRAVTTPIAINIATLLQAPVSLAILIVILSGVIGAAFSPLILKHINDERASGLALGLAAHAIGIYSNLVTVVYSILAKNVICSSHKQLYCLKNRLKMSLSLIK